MEEFLGWASSQGVSDGPDHKIQSSSCLGYSLLLSDFPDAGGRGLAAARDLEKGEIVLKVPKNALMSRETVMAEGGQLSKCLGRYPNLSSTQVLVIYLLSEVAKGKKSFWHPYLLQLPRNYDILASFTVFEVEALQVDDAMLVAQRASGNVHQEWKESQVLMNEMGMKQRFTNIKSWLWAFAAVSSRTLHVPWDAAGCLCPVGDLFNYAAPGSDIELVEDATLETEATNYESSASKKHKDNSYSTTLVPRNSGEESDMEGKLSLHEESPNKMYKDGEGNGFTERLIDGGYEAEQGAYCFYARKRYLRGEQVLLCYGVYTNLELLEHYGFVLKDNPNEKIYINLDAEMLTSRYWEKNHLYLQWDGKPSFSLLVALRFYATPQKLRKAIGHLAFSGLQISIENDIAVTKWLLEKCENLLARLPTTVEEDELLLQIIDRFAEADGLQFILDILEDIEMRQYDDHCVLLDQFPKWRKLHSKRCHLMTCEISKFIKIQVLQSYKEIELAQKTELGHSLRRWKLAIQWRLGYKRILHRAILYCNCQLEHLYSVGQ